MLTIIYDGRTFTFKERGNVNLTRERKKTVAEYLKEDRKQYTRSFEDIFEEAEHQEQEDE